MNRTLLLLLALLVWLLAACGAGPEPPAQDVQALLDAAQAALDRGEYDQAVANFQAALAQSKSLEAYFGLGNALTNLGRLDEAITAYQEALQINPNHVPTLSNLGVAYYQQGRLGEAQNTFRKVLSLNPNDAETHYLLAAALIQAGDLAAAEQELTRALALKPDLPEARFGMGVLRRLQGRTEEAIREFEAFLQGPPAQDPRARSEAERILQELRGQ
jgi:Flp pilus assembly protein TadD